MRKLTLASATLFIALLGCQKNNKDVSSSVTLSNSEMAIEEEAGRNCASHEVLQEQIAKDPARATFLEELEKKTRLYRGRETERGAREANTTLYVPVAVHIVLKSPSLVTDAQIKSQIEVLNKDFNKANSELSNPSIYLAEYDLSKVANCKIQFVVTQVIRKQTTATSFSTNDAVKRESSGGSNSVNSATTLNLWVCDLSDGLLGYAQFPGGVLATDGVVIDYQAFGTTATGYSLYSVYNKGRTATHEVGHWVNLRHIWGDMRCGNDLVDDTPAHDGSNGGCPAQGSRSKCTGKPLEQWMNYMDYTYDGCMYMFTDGQKTRMDAAIDNARKGYFSTTSPSPYKFL